MKSMTRSGDDRRAETREGRERRNDAKRKLADRMSHNIEQIAALLVFVPYVTTAAEADARRTEARMLESENALLSRMLDS